MKIEILQTNTTLKFAPIAWLLKAFQKTNYSHYMIRVTVEGMTSYYDSTGAGVRKTSASNFRKHYLPYRSFEVKKAISFIEFESFFSKHNGKKYAFKQIAGLFFKGIGILRHNPFGQGAKRITCNELVILFLNHFGYTSIEHTDCLDLNDTEEVLEGLRL